MNNNSRILDRLSLLRIPINYSSIQSKVILFVATFLAMFILGTLSAEAASYYVRAGATGANNGSDWSNAYKSLPSTLVRGSTYYVANGSYGSHTFNDSGTSVITIKGAISSDHGTDTGWDSSYGVDVSPATWGALIFTASYYVIDGQVGQWAPDLPGYVPYGFKILSSSSASWSVIKIGTDGGPHLTNFTFRHIEGGYTGSWGNNQDVFYVNAHNTTASYCWFHDAGRCNVCQYLTSNLVVEYSVLERNGLAQRAGVNTEHSEIYAQQLGGDNNVFRYNYIRDWRSTGGIMGHEENSSYGRITNFQIYGNVFVDTGYFGMEGGGNGVIGAMSAQTAGTFYIYNNTFVNLRYGGTVCTMGGYAELIIKNNLFYNCKYYNGTSQSNLTVGGSHSYNWYYGSGTQSETGIQNGTGDPFVNLAGKNYHLSTATNAGTPLSSPYNLDMNGITRSVDGTWDRGAFEYSSKKPSAPINLRLQ